ncbi:MAG: response regulator transcription factor [Chloroflexi bacterium]|nr:response regulator transcription factor [Chloroflexota bacterium]
MAKGERVLLVEDEPAFVATLRFQLQREGYEVRVAPDGPSALAAFARVRPDLVLLDLILPGMGGMEVCRQIRQQSSVPIIMLTARTAVGDKVAGLEVGADDYITKPIQLPELLARIKAALRRAHLATDPTSTVLSVGNLRIDLGRHAVLVGDREVQLRAKEFSLLTFLARNAGQVVTREQIMRRVWGSEDVEDSRTVDVHIRWLREKIEEEPSKPRLLQTVRNVGYRLAG